MLAIFIKRVFMAIPVLLAVATMTFFLIKLAPGGPFDAEKAVSPQVLKNLNAVYNLDASEWEQYTDYMTGVIQGDFGPSFKYPGRSVTEMIASGLPITFELAMYAILIALVIGVLSGVLAALKRNTMLDFIPMAIAMIGICVPTFLMGPLLVLIFGIQLELLPVAGWGQLSGDKILPSITLGFAYAAYIARLSRGGMLEVLNQDFIRTARAKGLTERMVVIKHAMQGGLIPVVSFLGPAIAGLLAGSFVVETIFQIPGLGRFYVEAALNRDYTMILGTTIFFSAMIVFFNLISDLASLWLNPRSRDV
ncbi:ABC transporter permease subunit [Gammaproteobacteria bacterium]|jgi:oligopeptide transport system permease protein|nr:ABC transporter permease subunit [Gammaproteobacteria bacterium]MDA7788309.1 ABC transporter permease subunit [Gammaproteobacteria bacterium]MDA9133533.1 ABC transporter permease subunit [Gammaproteobacteria bacterium]MDA9621789.1 ABC transporter permease subunit [Gammaproteobacteria bacterium]MDB9959107.1 ABC transporter permease subunit [Gammaproteobacteria bacterium]|tara:strand:- start:797 stop:1717 length:921 start_codon:yes stop_codon:yes gene_type:complete